MNNMTEASIAPDTTHMSVSGTIHGRHIEEPATPFMVRVLRAPRWNVLFKPARWEMWKVLAQTSEGSIRIAKYHFHRAEMVQFLGEA
jgi:hypothetical protein